MSELKGETKADGLAVSPHDPGPDTIEPQDGPLDRAGTEAAERAKRPGLDPGTTDGLSQSS